MEGIREIKSERYVAVIIAFAAGAFLLIYAYAFQSVARTNYRAGWEARNGDIKNIHRVEVDLLPDADIDGATDILVAWRARITLRTGEMIEYTTPGIGPVTDAAPHIPDITDAEEIMP